MTHSAFTRLAAAATISGLGDGATQVAGALLAMSLTRSPVLIAGLVGQRPLRALALAAALSNVGLGALFSVFVLFARVRLGTGPLGYGLLLAGAALGGLVTSVAGLTAPLWLGLAAIATVIALAWRPFGTLRAVGVSP